jgi:hypothetical protein
MSNSSRLMGGLMEASTSGSSSSGSRTPPSPPRRSTEGGGTAGQQARGRLLPPSEKARLELMQAVESYWPLFVVVWLGLCTCGYAAHRAGHADCAGRAVRAPPSPTVPGRVHRHWVVG